jgi:hypothetical protein
MSEQEREVQVAQLIMALTKQGCDPATLPDEQQAAMAGFVQRVCVFFSAGRITFTLTPW